MDIQSRIDDLLRSPKTILGENLWEQGQRPDIRVMRRVLLENGESLGAALVSYAYPRARMQEYRHLVVFTPEGGIRRDGRCVSRLDNAPTVDGPHVNDFGGPPGYPGCQLSDPHFHDWAGNRQLCKPKEMPPKLLYAREIQSRFNNIDDAFWWFCEQNQIGASSGDVPGWPQPDRLL